MKTLRKIALLTLISTSVLSTTSIYSMKPEQEKSFYTALAKWFTKSNFCKKLLMATDWKKLKEVDWQKVVKKVQELKK